MATKSENNREECLFKRPGSIRVENLIEVLPRTASIINVPTDKG